LPPTLVQRIASADVLIGGERHLSYFPDSRATRITLKADVEPVLDVLHATLEDGKQAVVLASGDPLWHGIAATLRRAFPAELLEIIPAPTAFQLAFAALAEPWHDATPIYALTPRPLSEVVAGVLNCTKAAVVTDRRNTPAVVAQALLEAGMAPDTACAICENLRSPDERIIRTTLEEAAQTTYAVLNVLVVWRDAQAAGWRDDARMQGNALVRPPISAVLPGLPDEAFSTSAGQITKREVRLLSLAELALGPGEILWDIGAGSGAISIEAARMQPTASVYAVERRSMMCGHIRTNLHRFPAPNLRLIEGTAPAACADWPAPHAVFIGGSGGLLPPIIDLVLQRLRSGGRLVMNLVALEHLHLVRERLPSAHVIQVQVHRTVPIQEMTRFEALNPVFIVAYHQNQDHTS
jgi:precorrin-6Y C5,15-methyltransferase (decarboxylating)